MLEAEDRQAYTEDARLGAVRGSVGVRRAAPGLQEAPCRDPTSSEVVTASRLRPAQVRVYMFRVCSQTELWLSSSVVLGSG